MNLTLEMLGSIVGFVVVVVTGYISLSKMVDNRMAPISKSIADITTAMAELRVLLVGYPGNPNGLAGAVKQLEAEVKDIRRTLNHRPKDEE